MVGGGYTLGEGVHAALVVVDGLADLLVAVPAVLRSQRHHHTLVCQSPLHIGSSDQGRGNPSFKPSISREVLYLEVTGLAPEGVVPLEALGTIMLGDVAHGRRFRLVEDAAGAGRNGRGPLARDADV